jgi:hypothetical protein
LQKAPRGLPATVTSPDSRRTACLGIISNCNRRHPRRSPSNSYYRRRATRAKEAARV